MLNAPTASLSKKNILVTGSCGTVGRELVEQLISNDNHRSTKIFGIDNNESGVFYQQQRYHNDPRVQILLADCRDRDAVMHVTNGVDVVFHAAALKHIAVCELAPIDAVKTNITGVQNVIDAANHNNVQKVIFTSTDKAVNPTNVMGTSVLMAERLLTAANSSPRAGGPVFASIRFGNVLGSQGSVLPIFHKQISRGDPVTLTDSQMTRFVASIGQSVQRIIESSTLAKGGEVFITKMPVARISDLARVMIEELAPMYGRNPSDTVINIVGAAPGEKLYEELMSSEETRRAIELENYFVVTPAFDSLYTNIDYNYESETSRTVDGPYTSSSQPVLSSAQVRDLLHRHGLLTRDQPMSEFL